MRDGSLPEAMPVYLSLGFHDHQPTGNFSWVYAKHYERAYRPFLDVMERHPDVPFSLHLTGPLLLWLAEEKPEYLARLRSLVASGRLELKGGGFYEPILALIPDADRREQLRRMTGYLVEQLGFAPTGAWLAERVWEPQLARVLAEAGLEYAVLDDSHFLAAGVDPSDTAGYYVTEEQGWRFDLFPISRQLRYLIPFHEPEETIGHLLDMRDVWLARRADGSLPPTTPPALAVYDDDGEKFGGWPGTNRHVYENGWLERFLSTLEKAVDDGWLRLTTLCDYRSAFPPLGRIYIPTGSYAEMLEWSGGFFRNFLVRYEEANLLHKRMLYTSGRVRRRLDELGEPPHSAGANDLHDALLAWDHVLRAQCNDAYWHGVFGGLYLPHLRQAAHADLLTAERLLGPAAGPSLEVLDLDLDAAEEVLLRSPELVAVIRPARGGALVAFDHLPSASALLDVLRRRREPEHGVLEDLAARTAPRLAPTGDAGPPPAGVGAEATAGGDGPRTIHEGIRMKEPGLERLLFVDTHARGAFLDHFFPVTTTAQAMHEGRAAELGDFLDVPYTLAVPADASEGDPHGPSRVLLSRTGTVAGRKVSIDKTYRLEAGGDPSLTVAYRVEIGRAMQAEPTGEPPTVAAARIVFAPEVDLTLLAGWSAERYVTVDGAAVVHPHLAGIASHPGARSVELVDQTRGLTVRLSWEADAGGDDLGAVCLHRYGIVTVSQSEDGFERIYQGTALLPAWTIPLQEGSILQIRLRLEVLTR
jgi:4-alpha-glucanotransferase